MTGKIGKYEIQADLGQGGFGRVFRAFDPTVGRPVAIKVLTTEGKDLLNRFRNEATAAGNLRHKNIVTIYEFGEHSGRPFLVMELLEGEDLQRVITSGRQLTVLQKMNIMAQVADGLHCAHASGVVHRDVKPANIRLLPDGTVKIMDFGIARFTREADATRLTRQGDLIGTILYMSPEQFSGGEADALCDIFAYGVTYYELMTGKHPFGSADARAVMFKITNEDPDPVRALAPECPDILENVIARAMQKDRELRYQSLHDLQLDAGPALMELQQEQARQRLGEAMRLFESKDLKAAILVIIEVLDLDPNNREARRLRESIQKQIQKEMLQPRIEMMLQAAGQQLSKRQFAEAIQNLHSAHRLDKTNAAIRSLLEQAQAQIIQCKEAARFTADARSLLDRGDLAGAFEAASNAIHLDPQSTKACRLLDAIRVEQKRWEEDRQLREALAAAAELVSAEHIEEAIVSLQDLALLHPESPEVTSALDAARQQRLEREGRERFRAWMADITDLLEQGSPAEAIERLNTLKTEFPDNAELQAMLSRAGEQLMAQRRAEDIEKAVMDAQEYADAHDFAAALDCVNAALQRYPQEARLTLFEDSICASQAAWEREQTVQQTAGICADLRRQNRIPEAIEALGPSLSKYPGEPHLVALEQELSSALQALERTEVIEKAVAEGEELIRQNRLEDAVRLLEDVRIRYPHESALQSPLSRALLIRWCTDAVASIRDEAHECHARDFESTIETIEQGLKEWPGETALTTLLEEALSIRGQWEREQDIRETGRRCEELVSGRRFASAVELVAASLERYPQQPELMALQKHTVRGAIEAAAALIEGAQPESAIELLRGIIEQQAGAQPQARDLLARAEEQIARARTEQAVRNAMQECERMRAEGNLAQSLESVESALNTYPNEPDLLKIAQDLRAELDRRKRAEAVGAALSEAKVLIGQDRLKQGIEQLEQACRQYPGEAQLDTALSNARRELEHRRRQETVRVIAGDARTRADAHDFEGAVRILTQGLDTYPGEKSLTELLELTLRSAASWEKQETVRRALADARQFSEQNRYTDALDALGAALRTHPGEPRLVEASGRLQSEWERRQDALRHAASQAQELIREGRAEDAVRILEEVSRQYGAESELSDLTAQARDAILTGQRLRALEQLVDRVHRHVEGHEFQRAFDLLNEGLKADPNEPRLKDLQNEINVAEGVWRTQQAVEEALRNCERLRSENRLSEAQQIIESAIREHGQVTPLSEVRDRLEVEVRETARRVRRDGDLNELSRLVRHAHSISDPAHHQEIVDLVQSVSAEYQDDREIQSAASAILSYMEGLRRAEEQLAIRNHVEALNICREYLAKYPGDAGFEEIHRQAEEMARMAGIQEARGAVDAERDLIRRIELLKNAAEKFQEEPSFSQDLLSAQSRLDEVNSAVDKARFRESAGDFDQAIAEWDGVRNLYAGYPGLDTEVGRVRAKLEQARSAAISKLAAGIQSHINEGDHETAAELLRRAQAEFPGEDAWADLDKRCRQAQARRAQAQTLLAEGESLCANGRLDAAVDVLRRAYETAEGDPAVRRAVLAAVLSRAEAALDSDWHGSDALVRLAVTVDPQAPVGDKLQTAIASRRREELVEECIDQARQLQESREIRGAIQHLERALSTYPDERRLAEFRDTLRAQFAAERLSDLSELRGLAPVPSSPVAPAERLMRLERARVLAGKYAEDREFTAALTQLEKQLRRPIPRLAPVAIAAGILVLAGVGWNVWRLSHRPVVLVFPVQVHTSPEGATVRVGDRSCTTPNCSLELPPGRYSVEARLDGYEPSVQPLALDRSHGREAIQKLLLDLKPIPSALQLSANFVAGTIALDGSAKGQLQNGQFSLESVPPGPHKLEVSSPEGAVTIEFETGPGRLPAISGPLQARDVEVIAMSNLGGKAHVISSQGAEKVRMDGGAAQDMPAIGLDLNNLRAGTHELTFGEGAGARNVVLRTGLGPTVNVVINSGSNTGTLVVETGADNVSVFLNDRKYNRLTAGGVLRIPLDASSYTVRVAKTGFNAQPPRITAQVRKREQVRVAFKLEPIPQNGSLIIAGALPGTEVRLDSVPQGAVQPDGSLNLTVSPGEHTVELRKSGHTGKRFRRNFSAGASVTLQKEEAELAQVAPPPAPPIQPPVVEAPPPPDPETQLWNRIAASTDPAVFEDYRQKFPNGQHSAEAGRRIEDFDWARTDQKDRGSIQRFISKHPGGKYAQQAKASLTELDQHDSLNADRQAIRDLLSRYAAAYNTRDANAVREIFPGVDFNKLRDSFKKFRYRMSLTVGEPQISGNTATVQCQESVEITDEQGRHPAARGLVVYKLRKENNKWIIEQRS
jgi:serine/threonine protein kinase